MSLKKEEEEEKEKEEEDQHDAGMELRRSKANGEEANDINVNSTRR